MSHKNEENKYKKLRYPSQEAAVLPLILGLKPAQGVHQDSLQFT